MTPHEEFLHVFLIWVFGYGVGMVMGICLLLGEKKP